MLLDDAAYRALHRKGVAGTWVEAGRLVRRWRLDQGLTQRELAERVDTTVGEVRRVEAGTARPQMVTLRRWLGVTGIAVGRWYPELA